MPDFGGRWSPGGDPSLDAVARTDRLIDALAAEQPLPLTDAGDAAIALLLAGWRDDLREAPAGGLVSPREAVTALRSGQASRRTARNGMAVLGSVAAALLCVGGFGAVVYGAGPGDSLYGLHNTLFGEPQTVRDDQVVLAAQTELNEVQNLIAQGRWEQAQTRLAAVTTTVVGVNDEQTQQDLLEQWNRLNVQVEARDANATPPPGPTSVTLPDGATVQLPVAEPTTPSSSDSSIATTTTATPSTTVATTPIPTPSGTTPIPTPSGTTPIPTPVGTIPVPTPVGTTSLVVPPPPVPTPSGTIPIPTPPAAAPIPTPHAAAPIPTPSVIPTPIPVPTPTPTELPVPKIAEATTTTTELPVPKIAEATTTLSAVPSLRSP